MPATNPLQVTSRLRPATSGTDARMCPRRPDGAVPAGTWSFPRFLVLLLTGGILALSGPASAATLAFNPRIGTTYTFEVAARLTSEFRAFEAKQPGSTAATGTISIQVIGFRQGMFILDIWENENHTRRFLKPDGTVVGAPGEDPSRIPVIWTLPAGDWQPGQVHRIQRALPAGPATAAAVWELTLLEVDAKSGRARIGLSGQVALPSDRLIQRTLKAKGTLYFNPSEGCFDQGEWTMNYSLGFANKEIAVWRDLWKVEESRTITFRLKGAAHD